jgi:hypothetical protein
MQNRVWYQRAHYIAQGVEATIGYGLAERTAQEGLRLTTRRSAKTRKFDRFLNRLFRHAIPALGD